MDIDPPIGILTVFLVDITAQRSDGSFHNALSSHTTVIWNNKKNIMYHGSIDIIADKSASSTNPHANLFGINAFPPAPFQPTLTFTEFRIEKRN